MHAKYMAWHKKQPKLARVLLKTAGYLIATLTCWIWFPAMVATWIVLTIICSIFEFIERA